MKAERYVFNENSTSDETFHFFGKRIPTLKVSDQHRILIVQDYPLITPEIITAFESFSLTRHCIVVTACLCDVHPYRLMKVDAHGYESFVLDIPRDIRGSRQKYPAVYSIKPALISIPPGFPLSAPPEPDQLDLFILDRDVLFDQTKSLESLMMKIHESGNHPSDTLFPMD